MTEKRFKRLNHFQIDDTFDSYRPMECASSLDADVICDLLNELHEENMKLKSENNMLKVTIGRNEAYINRLTHTSVWR